MEASRSCSRATATPITDHVALIDERFALHERRAAKICGLLAERPRTRLRDRPGAVGQRRGHAGLPDAVSEVLGHVDLLLARASASARPRTGGVVRFEAV